MVLKMSRSHLGPKIECLGLNLGKVGRSWSRLRLEAKRLSIRPQHLVYILGPSTKQQST